MRRFEIIFLCVLLLLGGRIGQAEDWGSFVVEEDEENVAPDPRHQARALMRLMTTEEKVYQLFIVTPEALTGENRTTALGEKNVLAARPVGGVILFGQNIASEKQLGALTEQLQAQAEKAGIYPLWIAVDEEGGAVSRVANKLGYPLALTPETMGKTGDEAQARAVGEQIAAYLKPLGINLDFAPVADVLVAKGAEIGERSFGADPGVVTRLTLAMTEGLREGGITPCMKHFPGHGAVTGSIHSGPASSRRTLEEMREAELVPFAAGIADQIEMIMISHLTARGLGDTVPASLSPLVIRDLLRGEMGYDGVVVTDALRMSSITADYKPGTAAVRALQAGADILLLPSSLDSAAQGIFKAMETGEITLARIEESVERILALKIRCGLIQ